MSGAIPERGRLLPDRPFPPYGYVPGRFPHPFGDPQGHSYREGGLGGEPSGTERFDPARWRESDAYLYGCDLFNHGYYWEAHEEWEQLWLAAGRRGITADFLKALIKLAALGVKIRERNPRGAARHAHRAAELIEQVRGTLPGAGDRYAGLPLGELQREAAQVAEHPPCLSREEPLPPVEIVFEWVIVPQ